MKNPKPIFKYPYDIKDVSLLFIIVAFVLIFSAIIGNNLFGILLLDMTLQRNLEKVRRDFVANVSHELRSPLTSLIGFIETLLNGNVEEEKTKKKFLNIMDEEAKRMNRLIDDILSLSKVETEEHITPNTTISIINPIQYVISSIKERGFSNNNIIFEDLRQNVNDPCFIIGNICLLYTSPSPRD